MYVCSTSACLSCFARQARNAFESYAKGFSININQAVNLLNLLVLLSLDARYGASCIYNTFYFTCYLLVYLQ